MIDHADDHVLKKQFARSAAFRIEQNRFFREVERRHKETLRSDRVEDNISDLAMTTALATEAQLVEFRVKLEDYRTATVESLMENERQLIAVRKRLDETLSEAFMLPDGRRVFKTEDGLRIFDERGVELSGKDIDPDMIEDWRPRAEGYLRDLMEERGLVADREQRLELLEKIDATEARIEEGRLTVEDMTALENALEAVAPIDIRNRVAGPYGDDAPFISRDFGAATMPIYGVTEQKLDFPELGR